MPAATVSPRKQPAAAESRKRHRPVISDDSDSQDDVPLVRPSRKKTTQQIPHQATPSAAQAQTKGYSLTDDEDEAELDGQDAALTTRSKTTYYPNKNAANKKRWTYKRVTVRSYRSLNSKTGTKRVETQVTDSILAKDVPKSVKRQSEWDDLTAQERESFEGGYVEYLISKTVG